MVSVLPFENQLFNTLHIPDSYCTVVSGVSGYRVQTRYCHTAAIGLCGKILLCCAVICLNVSDKSWIWHWTSDNPRFVPAPVPFLHSFKIPKILRR